MAFLSSAALRIFLALLFMAVAAPAKADCTSPAATSGTITWNSTTSKPRYCDGTNWIDVATVNGVSSYTTSQRNALTPTEGMVIYNSTTKVIEYYNGSYWYMPSVFTATSGGNFASGSSLATNLAYYWNMNATGTTVTSSVGTNTMTLTGTPTTDATGINAGSGGARCFNGTSQYGTLGTTLNYTPSTAWSISFWYKGTATGSASIGSAPLFGWSSGAVNWQAQMNAGKFSMWVAPSSWASITSTSSINNNAWHHVVLSHTTSQTFDMYIDGVLEVSNASLTSSANFNIPTFMYGYNGAYAQGCLDEIGFWTRTLSQNDVNILYNTGTGGFYR